MKRLSGRIALVTGAARGIGRGIALAFAREGADVAINDLPGGTGLAEVAEEIRGMGRRAWQLPADVSDDQAVRTMVSELLEEAGRVDVLVTNAGVADVMPLTEMTVQSWDRMIACHLRGTFLCTHYVLPGMLDQGNGVIITIGSQLGQAGRAGMVHYSAAKGGVIAFTKALAREVSPHGIRVNCIAPGPISTGLLEQDEETQQRLRAALPLGRFGSVQDVAPTAVFLASDDAGYYTGQTLGPNGGDVML